MSKYRQVQVRLIRMLLRRLAGFVRRCKSPDLLAERVGIHRITNHYIEKREGPFSVMPGSRPVLPWYGFS